MITITLDGNGYRMKFSNPGTGWKSYSCHAKDVNQIHQAIDHHLRPGVVCRADNPCPLCLLTTKKGKNEKATR